VSFSERDGVGVRPSSQERDETDWRTKGGVPAPARGPGYSQESSAPRKNTVYRWSSAESES
jgi:hypothetical protein